MVVDQLVEWSLPTPEIRGSNPMVYLIFYQLFHCLRRDESKEKEAGNGPSLKKVMPKGRMRLTGTLPQLTYRAKKMGESSISSYYELGGGLELPKVREVLGSIHATVKLNVQLN